MKSFALLYPKKWKDLKYRDLQNVRVIKGKELDLSQYPKIRKKIEEAWKRKKAQNKNIFPGEIYRLSGYSIKNSHLILDLGKTDYKKLVGTNHLSSFSNGFFNFLKKLGVRDGDLFKYFSMALSVGMVVETKDDYILIARRSEKVESYKNTFHTIAGQVEFKKGEPLRPNIFKKAVINEMTSEAGLKENEYKLYFMGLVINNQNLKPELIFIAKSKVNLVDILLRKKTEGFEARLMFGLKKEDLKSFLKSFPQQEFCPPGLAAWEMYSKIEKL